MKISKRKLSIYIGLYAITIAMIISVIVLTPHTRNDFPWLRTIIIIFASVLLTKYLVYMTLAPWHDVVMRLKEKRFAAMRKKPFRPLVSVLIPAWNEEVGLVETVRTILASEYRRIEIIVVNDGSTDSSDQLIRAFKEAYDREHAGDPQKIAIKYFYKQNGGKGRALNYGLERAEGEIIMSIDADCVLTPTTVGNFVKCFIDPNVKAAVGNVKIGNTSTLLGTVQHLEFLFSFYFKKAESIANIIYIIGGAAGAFRREVFETVGGYDPKNITEDIDLSVRIQKAGMRIVYASDAIVYTEGALSLDGLMKQRLRWKRGRFQTFHEHRDLILSTARGQNKFLTWIMLPLALFGDVQLFFELYFIAFLYVYSAITHDFSSFISGIIVVSSMFAVQMLFERNNPTKLSFFLLAPIGWLLFYVSTFVEYNALIESIWGISDEAEARVAEVGAQRLS